MFTEYLQKSIFEVCRNHHLHEREVYLFGVNAYVGNLQKILQKNGIQLTGIVDNAEQKQGTIVCGLHVFSPRDVIKMHGKQAYFVIQSKYAQEMQKQLQDAGYIPENDITILEDSNGLTFRQEYMTKLQHGLELYHGLTQKYPGATLLLLECNSLGDPYLYSCYLAPYLRMHDISNYVFLHGKESMKPLVEAHQVKHQEVLSIQDLEALYILDRLMPQTLNLVLLHKSDSLLWHICTAKGFHFLHTLTCYTLGLPTSVNVTAARRQGEAWKKRYPSFCGPGILLVPKAKSVYEQTDAFWTTLVRELRKRGFCVYCNVGPEEVPLSDTVPLNIQPIDIAPLCEAIGCVIALRSGFCDLMAEAQCKKIVLYNDTSIYWNHISEFAFFSLNRCGLCKDAKEIVMSGIWQEDAESVLAQVKGRGDGCA